MRYLYLLILITALFTGCASKTGYFTSTISIKEHKDVKLYSIADDMYDYIVHTYNPAQTTFYLYTNNLDKDFFNYLVKKLRNAGYAISSTPNAQNVIYLSYNILEDANSVLSIWNIGSTKINKAYTIKENKLINEYQITGFNVKDSL